jgi:hypothetical protein
LGVDEHGCEDAGCSSEPYWPGMWHLSVGRATAVDVTGAASVARQV